MKIKATLILLICLNFSALYAQVKIGDNPNVIDPTSILELQSADKVFVLTRINDSQMNSLTPLEGAMVFNTDQNCVFQFDGSNWVSLCNSTESITFIIDNGDSYTYINEEGTTYTINKAQLIDNGDGIFTFDNGGGTPITFDGTDNQQLTLTGNLLSLENGGNADLSIYLNTLTTIIENANGTFSYVDEDGSTTTVDVSNLETLTSLALNA
ncbi:hypothetical protein ACFSTE_09530, partial [Aquimarina hainanensis]